MTAQEKTVDEKATELALKIVDDWKNYWLMQSDYSHRVIDANMRHHLAGKISEALKARYAEGERVGFLNGVEAAAKVCEAIDYQYLARDIRALAGGVKR